MKYAMLLIAALCFGTSASVATADNGREIPNSGTAAANSPVDDAGARRYAFGSDTGRAWHQNAGKWACMAKSTYGSHGSTTVWSAYTSSQQAAERSALQKCNVAAANKQDCRVLRCWIEDGQ